jgi:hypothetical protein
MTRLRASTFALPPSRFRLRASRDGGQVARRRTSRATADGSSFGEARSAGPRRRLGIRAVLATALAVLIGGGSSVLACPMCFGAEETSMVDGTRLGIVVMLGITLAVQGGFVGFFLYLRKRAKRIADVELDTEWSELQRASSRS